MLQLLGLQVDNIRAAHKADERYAIIRKFNDPNSEVDVLVTNIRIASAGIDLQGACCRGFLMCWPWNANTLMQILGRLVRIGQARFVEWKLYTIGGTIFEKHEGIMWRKYSRQLAAESAVQGITGDIGILVMYEIIRVLFNQPYNRYSFEVLVDAELGSFSTTPIIKRGKALSLIARYALQNPDKLGKAATCGPLDLYACACKLAKTLEETPDFKINEAFLNEWANCANWEKTESEVGGEASLEAINTAIHKRLRKIQLLEAQAEKARKREERLEKAKLRQKGNKHLTETKALTTDRDAALRKKVKNNKAL